MNGENPEVDAKTAREWLDEFGLICCATHRGLDALQKDLNTEIETHQTLGCDYTAIGGLWDRPNEAASYRRFIQESKPIIDTLKSKKIRFGYHNHSHEWVLDAETGKPCYEIVVEEASSDLMLEVDTYWVSHAGLDPARLLLRCSGRVPVIHLKDMQVDIKGQPIMAPVGEGNLDWPRILTCGDSAGVEWFVVEQDECYRDPFDCLASSRNYLKSLGY